MRRPRSAKEVFDGGNHQIAHQFSRDAGIGDRRPGDDFAVAGVNHERHPHDLAAGVNFEMIGAPAPIRTQRDDDAVMGASGPARRVALQREAVVLHDPQNPFHVERWFAIGAQFAVRQGANPAIAISGTLVDNGAEFAVLCPGWVYSLCFCNIASAITTFATR